MGEIGELPGDARYVLIGADCAEILTGRALSIYGW